MSDERVQRKVTVILAADVAGYSTMMEGNEEQTLKNLKACRAISDGLISELSLIHISEPTRPY